MNTQEFKAWFEGFTENVKGSPTEKQWKRIQERVGEITPEPTTYRYFYDHYYNPYRTYWGSPGYYSNYASQVIGSTPQNSVSNSPVYMDLSAFSSLGKAEATSIA